MASHTTYGPAQSSADVTFLYDYFVPDATEFRPWDAAGTLLMIARMVEAIEDLEPDQPIWGMLEAVAANSIDGLPSDVGDLAIWTRLCHLAGKTPPDKEWAGDRSLATYWDRFTVPNARRLASNLGLDPDSIPTADDLNL